jgi:hypothetical protein
MGLHSLLCDYVEEALCEECRSVNWRVQKCTKKETSKRRSCALKCIMNSEKQETIQT